MKIRIDAADRFFSLCVRERAVNRCERCGRTSDQGRLDCSHFFSRRHNSTRYEPSNAFAHCFQCHQQLGGDPVEFVKWAESKLGPTKVEALRTRAGMTLTLSKVDKQYIAEHYRKEHRAMLEKRKAGHAGYLHFTGWGEG